MELQLDETANGSEITLSAGQPLTLSLPENSTTGYVWRVLSSGAPVCKLAADSHERTSTQMGAPGIHKWSFVAEKPGEGAIELRLARPWQPNEIKQSLSLRVRVT